MAVAQAAGQLLLLQVHHAHDVGQLGVGIGVVKQGALGLHAHLGEHDPAHPVELRQGDGAAEAVGKHVPQPLLKFFGVGVFEHFVLADDVMRVDGFGQARGFKLFAGDAGEHHAVPPRKRELAFVRPFGLHELRVAL